MPYFMSIFDSVVGQVFNISQSYKLESYNNKITLSKFNSSIEYLLKHKSEIQKVIDLYYKEGVTYNQDFEQTMNLIQQNAAQRQEFNEKINQPGSNKNVY